MTLEIPQPELETLIRERMRSGTFQSVEDFLLQTLRAVEKPELTSVAPSGRTGADLIAAMQACPDPDFFPMLERLRRER